MVNERIMDLSMMNKKIIIAVCMLICGIFMTAPALSVAAKYITAEQAKAIALKHAGYAETDVRVVKLISYNKRMTQIYDIIFLTNNGKYIYEIDAASGEVLAYYLKGFGKHHFDSYHHNNQGMLPNQNSGGQAMPNQNGGNGYISPVDAKNIALNHAQITDSGIVKYDQKLKNKNGFAVYDIEFEHGGMEYEYRIDAVTGEIISWEYDWD